MSKKTREQKDAEYKAHIEEQRNCPMTKEEIIYEVSNIEQDLAASSVDSTPVYYALQSILTLLKRNL